MKVSLMPNNCSPFYTDQTITYRKGFKMIEVYNLDYTQGSSDKVYTLTLQEDPSPLDPSLRYYAVCYYGRRHNGASVNPLGAFPDLASAHHLMTLQLNKKRKKEYIDRGHYLDANAKASANGALGSKVLEFLRATYLPALVVESPTGDKRTIVGIKDDGSLTITDGTNEVDIPFGKYGALKVIQ
jgi:hypothetical protein